MNRHELQTRTSSESLEELALFDGTKVADGDISLACNMKKTWIQYFKHYNIQKSEITNVCSDLAYL